MCELNMVLICYTTKFYTYLVHGKFIKIKYKLIYTLNFNKNDKISVIIFLKMMKKANIKLYLHDLNNIKKKQGIPDFCAFNLIHDKRH